MVRRTCLLEHSNHGLALALILAFWVSPSFAVTPTDPVAADLKRLGDTAIDAGRYEVALDAYSKSLGIEPSPALYYNRGRALQALGRHAEALADFEQFKESASAELLKAVPQLEEMIGQVRQQVAEIVVTCTIPAATLRLGAKVLELPLQRPLRLDPATVEIEVSAPDYESWSAHLTLTGGEHREIAPQLRMKDVHGTVLVSSPTVGATVQIDGKTIGTVPLEFRLAPGAHAVTLQHPDFETAYSRIEMRPGERRSLSVELQKAPRWYGRWWFWTGVGVAVATGAVVGVAYATEKTPSSGDIAPGRVKVPLVAW